MNLKQLSFLGDAVFELLVREHAIECGVAKLKDLHEFTQKFVTAENQMYFAEMIVSEGILTDGEEDILRRGRNIKTHKSPKNCNPDTYKRATAFECLIGYLYLTDKNKLKEVFDYLKNV